MMPLRDVVLIEIYCREVHRGDLAVQMGMMKSSRRSQYRGPEPVGSGVSGAGTPGILSLAKPLALGD